MKSKVSNNALFPDKDEKNQVLKKLWQSLDEIQIENSTVTTMLDLTNFRKQLTAIDFNQSNQLSDMVDWTIQHLQKGLVQMTHPGYMGLFNPAPTFPAEVANIISTAFNPQNCVWSHAPVAVEIESHVIKQITTRLGLTKSATGHFTSGGSEANATAFVCALHHKNSDFAEEGVTSFRGQPCIYVSKESHLAWLKIAVTTGVGRKSIRLIATDGQGRMDTVALRKAIKQDIKARKLPVMVVATAGTTNAGKIDPIISCRKICNEYKLWLHVDAAWGGALLVSDIYKNRLDGIESADSITIDAHKWFATTMGAGMFFTRHKSVLSSLFSVSTDYMPSNDIEQDLYVNSMLWSRRFIGLPLFMSLATVGWQGYAQHIEHGIDLIAYLSEELTTKGWQLVNHSDMAIACLLPPDNSSLSPSQIVAKIVDKGEQWISVTKFEEQSVIRICITNGMTTQNHIDALIKNLLETIK